jgi:hypothetical protein
MILQRPDWNGWGANSQAGSGPSPNGEKAKEKTQHNAEDDAGDDREIESRISPLDPDIARQPPEPSRPEPAPEHEAENDQRPTLDDQEFAHFAHRGKSWRERGNASAAVLLGNLSLGGAARGRMTA